MMKSSPTEEGKLSRPHPALKEITHQQWTEITMKLTAYTLGFFRRYGSSDVLVHGGDVAVDSDVILPGGYSAADVSQEIVFKVLKGARSWDPEKHGDLLDYMISLVRSLANHCIRSWSGRFEIVVEDSEELSAEDLIDRIAAADAREDRADLMSPEQLMPVNETEIEKRELIDLILNVASTDTELEQLVLAFLEDPNPRRRLIAAKLGKTPEDITNLVKRLRTKALKATKSQTKMLGEEENGR
jgi:DNA-directed RNA polymerase specialized sigma24 family protein